MTESEKLAQDAFRKVTAASVGANGAVGTMLMIGRMQAATVAAVYERQKERR